jgi:hypothetical protein
VVGTPGEREAPVVVQAWEPHQESHSTENV